MLTILQKLIYSFAVAFVAASSDWQFSYEHQGYDFEKAIPPKGWKGVNRCGLPNNQSPINLMDPYGQFGYIYGKVIPAEVEDLEVAYQDPSLGSRMSFEKNNFFMYVNKLPDGSPPSYMKSRVANLYYDFDQETYYPRSFHVHYTTEHYFNGRKYEISMHTNHNTSRAGSHDGTDMELFTHSFSFDSEEYDRSISAEEQRIIDNFFDDLNLQNRSIEDDVQVQGIRFREFMSLFDYSNRWTYLGGAAFPPCNQINFWQILHTVYPIKSRHAEMIKQTFAEKADILGAQTNNRGIYPVNGHRVRYVAGLASKLRILRNLGLAAVIMMQL